MIKAVEEEVCEASVDTLDVELAMETVDWEETAGKGEEDELLLIEGELPVLLRDDTEVTPLLDETDVAPLLVETEVAPAELANEE